MKIALACALLLATALACAQADDPSQADDPLKSPACGEAIARLEAARTAHEAAATVSALRSRAANTCLGSDALPRRPPRVAREPIAVAPPQIEVAPNAPSPPTVKPLPPPVAVDHLPAPAACDPGGCWSNDGSHLQYVPPSLAGPRGLCTQQGGQVYCP